MKAITFVCQLATNYHTKYKRDVIIDIVLLSALQMLQDQPTKPHAATDVPSHWNAAHSLDTIHKVPCWLWHIH